MEQTRKKSSLLVIDMQNDFTNEKEGTLFVKGAEEDVAQASVFLNSMAESIGNVVLTEDSHYPFSIFFTEFWTDADGKEPEPYTVITLEDLKSGKYRSRKGLEHWADEYVKTVTQKKKQLTLWPHHCMYGTKGQCIDDGLMECVSRWAVVNGGPYYVMAKGDNLLTEHYSAFEPICAPFGRDEELRTAGKEMLGYLNQMSETVYVVGEAMNYCVKETLASIIDMCPEMVRKLVILTDCMSPIGDFDIEKDEVFSKIVEMGGEITTSREVMLRSLLHGESTMMNPINGNKLRYVPYGELKDGKFTKTEDVDDESVESYYCEGEGENKGNDFVTRSLDSIEADAVKADVKNGKVYANVVFEKGPADWTPNLNILGDNDKGEEQ